MNNPRRVAIVTGSARGIGAAIARRPAVDGLAVAVVDLDEEQTENTVAAIAGAGGTAIGVGADIAQTEPMETAVARVADELGPPTVLVNNAGILRDNLIFKMTDDDWGAVVAVHLRGAFLMSRAVQRHHVTVNAIAPGFIATDMLRQTAERMKTGYEELVETLAIEVPVRRIGQPEDIAHLASFFCSEGAAFISGQVVYAAGGPKA